MSSFLKLLMVIALFPLVVSASGIKLSKEQIEILKTVRSVAMSLPNKYGQTFENTAMAICLAETSAGVYRLGDVDKKQSVLKASFGIMQMKLSTARFVQRAMKIKEFEGMSDIAIANKLMGDDKFNAKVAVYFLNWLSHNTKSYFQLVSRYNGGNKNYPYYKKVKKYLSLIEKNKNVLI
jgi:hypothetical protein